MRTFMIARTSAKVSLRRQRTAVCLLSAVLAVSACHNPAQAQTGGCSTQQVFMAYGIFTNVSSHAGASASSFLFACDVDGYSTNYYYSSGDDCYVASPSYPASESADLQWSIVDPQNP